MQALSEYSSTLIITPQDVAAPAATTGAWIDAENLQEGKFVVMAHLTAVATAVAQTQIADNAAGANPVNVVGSTVTLTGGAGNTDEIGVITFDGEELRATNAAKTFVGCQVTTTAAGDDISVSLEQWLRYATT